jgi:hypothetical protein
MSVFLRSRFEMAAGQQARQDAADPADEHGENIERACH